jgi:hypothetical protein
LPQWAGVGFNLMRATRMLPGSLGSGSSETRVGTAAPNASQLPWKDSRHGLCYVIDRVGQVQQDVIA